MSREKNNREKGCAQPGGRISGINQDANTGAPDEKKIKPAKIGNTEPGWQVLLFDKSEGVLTW